MFFKYAELFPEIRIAYYLKHLILLLSFQTARYRKTARDLLQTSDGLLTIRTSNSEKLRQPVCVNQRLLILAVKSVNAASIRAITFSSRRIKNTALFRPRRKARPSGCVLQRPRVRHQVQCRKKEERQAQKNAENKFTTNV